MLNSKRLWNTPHLNNINKGSLLINNNDSNILKKNSFKKSREKLNYSCRVPVTNIDKYFCKKNGSQELFYVSMERFAVSCFYAFNVFEDHVDKYSKLKFEKVL